MKQVASFSWADLLHALYVRAVLQENGIDCVLRNGNLAVAMLMDTAWVHPELWVDEARAGEAGAIVRQLRASRADGAGTPPPGTEP